MGRAGPVLASCHKQKAGVEQSDITKEGERIVLTGGEKNRSQETARHSENGHKHGVQPNRQYKSGRRDQGHEQKSRDQSENRKMIVGATGKSDGIENQNAGGTKSLRRDRVLFPFEGESAGEKSKADHEPDGHPDFRWDEVMLKGILHKERHPEEEGKPADPGEKLRSMNCSQLMAGRALTGCFGKGAA